jgi:hypothetical protein
VTSYLEDDVARQVQSFQQLSDKIAQDSAALPVRNRVSVDGNNACNFDGVICGRLLRPVFSSQDQTTLEAILDLSYYCHASGVA